MSRRQFAALLVAGAMLRAAALPWPGTSDVTIFKVWSYNAALRGVGAMYGVGGSPPERRVLEYAGTEALATYPPLAMYELGVAGQAYRAWSHRRFPNSAALNVAVKLPAMVADVALMLVLWWTVRRLHSESRARWVVAAYWLNPAVAINGAALGYLDLQYTAPAVGSIVAAASGFPTLAGGLIAAAALTKPQAVFVGPAVALALWACGSDDRRRSRLVAASGGAMVAFAILVAPVVAAGGWANMLQAIERIAYHDTLSSQECNLWWIVGWVLRVRYSMHDMGFWAAVTAPARILGIGRVVELGYPDPKTIGVVLTIAATAWAVWTVVQSAIGDAESAIDVWLLADVGAFTVHAYATLSAQVHENHMVAAVPLLVLAAAGRPRFTPICILVTAVVALNHNLFYGFGNDIGYALPRALTIIDATVVLAFVNCAALWWHALRLKTECSTAAAPLLQPAPA
jgi:hypothetical protein